MFEYYKCYILVELKFLEELLSIKQVNQKKCNICHYWYFLDKGFAIQSDPHNGCHDLLMMSMNLSDIAILNIKGANYCFNISGISKCEAIDLMQNIDLIKNSRALKT